LRGPVRVVGTIAEQVAGISAEEREHHRGKALDQRLEALKIAGIVVANLDVCAGCVKFECCQLVFNL
jgi:hypothetical protein